MTYKVNLINENVIFPKNSAIVPLNQEAANVAIHLLEPNSPESLVSLGFFNSIFEQKEYAESYILEELAEVMLANDESLRKEFVEKLKNEKFASTPSARLAFFYQHSPYLDKRIGLYPIKRITKNLENILN